MRLRRPHCARRLLLPATLAIACTNDYGALRFMGPSDGGTTDGGGASGRGGRAGTGTEAATGGGPGGDTCSVDCSRQGGGEGFGCVHGRCGCSIDSQCGTIVGFCREGLCECGGSLCRTGESCARHGSSTVCRCNGGPACRDGETCCPRPRGCTSEVCN